MKNFVNAFFTTAVITTIQKTKYAAACIVALLMTSLSFGQVNLIAAGDGGFENGTTPAANGWTAANSSGSVWICNSGAGAFAGSNSGYISSGGTTYGYTDGSNNISHLYRNVAIPAGVSGITLSFQLKSGGTIGTDRFFVSIGGASTTVNATVTSGYITIIPGATLLYVQPALIPSYNLIAIHLPNSYAGTTVRLIFSWMNDGSTQTNPNPASIDNVSLTYATTPATAGTCGYTFAPTGAVHSYSVPIGCSQLAIDAWGGGGGTIHYNSSLNTSFNLGGLGGRTQATVAVTPSTTGSANVLQVRAGGVGANATSGGGGAGGFNGGGDGSSYNTFNNAGGGGGASDVRVSPYGLADRLVVAGGGGGGGFNSGGARQYERGGNGGGTTGEAGYKSNGFDAANAGQAGTPSAGGAKATGSATGSDGALGTGGSGTSTASTAIGGGGGGGYYGGGSGFFGGGGGGSSYAVPSATAVTHTQGITPYNGIVYITPIAPTAFTVNASGPGGCASPAVTISLSGSQTDVNYQLYLGGTAVGSSVTGTGSSISFAPVSTGGTYTVAAYYTGYSGCPTIMTGSATVAPSAPDVSSFATAASSPCLGSASTVTVTSSTLVNGTSYTVDYTLSGANTGSFSATMAFGAGSGTFTILAANLPNAGATTVTTNSVTIVSTTCGSNTTTGNVANFSVVTSPGSISVGSSAICIGLTTTVSNTTPGGTWSSSNPTVASVTSGGIVTGGTSAGGVTITYSIGCGTPATTNISVVSSAGTLSGSPTVCVGATSTLSSSSSGGTWSTSNASIATIDPVTGVVHGVAAGAVTISYTLICVSTAPGTVIAAPGTLSIGSSSICSGLTTTVSNTVSGGTWSSDNVPVASVTAGGVVTGGSIGTANITYATGCGTPAVTAVNVTSGASAISGATSVCITTSTQLSNAASGGTWSSSNATIATVSTTGLVTGLVAGTVTISYSAGCIATSPMTVLAAPGVISGGTGSICSGVSVALSNTVAGGTWSSDNVPVASVTAGGVVTGGAAGTANITYSTGCGTDAVQAVTVTSGAGPISGASSVCVAASTPLSNTTAGGTWSSSNPAIATISTTGVVTGQTAGVVTITYSVGCTATMSFTVLAAPGAITGTAAVCSGATTTLNNPVAGGVWSSNNVPVASVSAGGVVTGGTAGTATITYTTGCGTPATILITVNPVPSVAAITGTPTTICVAGNTVLANATAGGTWTSSAPGIAAVNASGVVTGVAAGTATISYSVTNSCGSSDATVTITVDAANGGVITGVDSVCKGLGHQVTLSNSVTGGTWTSSNTSRATVNPSTGEVTGVSTGTFTITYVVTNTCGTFTVTNAMYVRAASKCASGIDMDESKDGELKVFPNPNAGTFTMNLLSANNEPVQVIITNVVGEKVQEFNTVTNTVRNIKIEHASGIYFLTAITAHGTQVVKVVMMN